MNQPLFYLDMHYKCPICGKSSWMARSSSQTLEPAKSRVLDETFVEELGQAFDDAASGKESVSQEKASLLDGVVVCQCQACGYIALFNYDRVASFFK